jgi:hypothetical protein
MARKSDVGRFPAQLNDKTMDQLKNSLTYLAFNNYDMASLTPFFEVLSLISG